MLIQFNTAGLWRSHKVFGQIEVSKLSDYNFFYLMFFVLGLALTVILGKGENFFAIYFFQLWQLRRRRDPR